MRARWIGFMLLATLSACSQSVVRDYPTTTFSSLEYGTQVSRGTVPVTVLGNAGGLGGARLSETVVSHMQGADWPPHARFASAAAPDRDDMYSYVLLFNGPVDVTSSDLCAERARALPSTYTGHAVDGVMVVAGLCRYNKVASGVTARATKVLSPEDPEFRRLIVTTVQELTRPETGFRNDGGMSDSKGGGR
jgi:hypothetical protein